MEIAAVLNVHDYPDVIRDTIESISAYVTDKILLIVDGASWPKLKNETFAARKMEGFYHGAPRAPYRNVALSLQTMIDEWPKADWYMYCEYDVLFGSSRIVKNLGMAADRGVWMLGSNGRIDDKAIPMVQSIVRENFQSVYYMLGACLFFHRYFFDRLKEINFFERFLNMTSGFSDGYFPHYSGYDISEHMYPTLCRHLGGHVGVLSTYDERGMWHGSFDRFPMRWKPELDPEKDDFPEACIMHPLKAYDHPLRVKHREKRKLWISDLNNAEATAL